MFFCVCALNCSAVSTLHDHMDYSPPGYSVHEIFQTRILAAKLLQSCPTLCNPIDGSPPGSPVPGILQARTLEWVAICFSNAWKWKMKVKSLSRLCLLATPWTAAYQAPPSMGFSRQEHWSGSGLLFPTPGYFPDPRIEPTFLASVGGFFITASPGKSSMLFSFHVIFLSLFFCGWFLVLCNCGQKRYLK